jgi:hypothetical protein
MTVIHGDCLAVMPTLEAESVDAIVCDPPYGLSFMGKNWDHGIPGVAFWAEALRVAKPGAHLVAFGGTRTFHRLACAIEDAGWEIRDTISWLYGSGFPKSLDVSKALDKQRQDAPDVRAVAAHLRDALQRSGKSRGEIDAHFGSANIGQYWFSPERNAQVPAWDKWLWLKQWLGFGDEMDAEVWRLNGRKGQPGEAWHERELIGQQDTTTLEVAPGEGRERPRISLDVTAPATDAAKQWAGWGTALKPAWEPIILARKPLGGTVAQTVIQWGTGAINVDATRIGSDTERGDRYNGKAPLGGATGVHVGTQEEPWQVKAGRWPANVVLSHAPECRQVGTRKVKTHGHNPRTGNTSSMFGPNNHAGGESNNGHADADGTETVPAWECAPDCPVAMLDAQSGERKTGKGGGASMGLHGGTPRGRLEADPERGYGDVGGASRFFYCAKAPSSERWGILLCDCQADKLESWQRPAQSPAALTDTMLPERATCEDASTDACGLSIPSFGNEFTGLSRAAGKSTTSTATSRTTDSKTCGSSVPPSTSESTAGVSSPAISGGSHAAGAGSSSQSHRITGTSLPRAGRSTAVVGPVTSLRQSKPNVCAECGKPYRVESHATVKPLALMRWLCRLVTPPGGVILDPFTGSGSTGCAAVLEGFRFVGVEQEAEYVQIAERRIAHWAATVTTPDPQTELEVA